MPSQESTADERRRAFALLLSPHRGRERNWSARLLDPLRPARETDNKLEPGRSRPRMELVDGLPEQGRRRRGRTLLDTDELVHYLGANACPDLELRRP